MADKTQTAVIIIATLLGVLCLEYCKARVIDQYLSRLIKHILKIEAVHKSTSMAFHKSHQMDPKYQYRISSFANENGMIIKPRDKSATANDAINQFCIDFSCLSVAMATTTSKFPKTIMISIMLTKMAIRTV
jgi:hypothetical protein